MIGNSGKVHKWMSCHQCRQTMLTAVICPSDSMLPLTIMPSPTVHSQPAVLEQRMAPSATCTRIRAPLSLSMTISPGLTTCTMRPDTLTRSEGSQAARAVPTAALRDLSPHSKAQSCETASSMKRRPALPKLAEMKLNQLSIEIWLEMTVWPSSSWLEASTPTAQGRLPLMASISLTFMSACSLMALAFWRCIWATLSSSLSALKRAIAALSDSSLWVMRISIYLFWASRDLNWAVASGRACCRMASESTVDYLSRPSTPSCPSISEICMSMVLIWFIWDCSWLRLSAMSPSITVTSLLRSISPCPREPWSSLQVCTSNSTRLMAAAVSVISWSSSTERVLRSDRLCWERARASSASRSRLLSSSTTPILSCTSFSAEVICSRVRAFWYLLTLRSVLTSVREELSLLQRTWESPSDPFCRVICPLTFSSLCSRPAMPSSVCLWAAEISSFLPTRTDLWP